MLALTVNLTVRTVNATDTDCISLFQNKYIHLLFVLVWTQGKARQILGEGPTTTTTLF